MSDKYELYIQADTNDADYITSTNTVTMEDINRILPVIEAIKALDRKKSWYNWPNSEYRDEDTPHTLYSHVDPDLIDQFSDYCPYGEDGIHTITSVVYYPLPNKVKLL